MIILTIFFKQTIETEKNVKPMWMFEDEENEIKLFKLNRILSTHTYLSVYEMATGHHGEFVQNCSCWYSIIISFPNTIVHAYLYPFFLAFAAISCITESLEFEIVCSMIDENCARISCICSYFYRYTGYKPFR